MLVPIPVKRLEPPAELTMTQAAEWRAIVGSMPVDWFDPGCAPMLHALCGHICEERRLRKLIAEFDIECVKTPEGLSLYDGLTKAHDRQSRAMIALSRQLRLTLQARYRGDAADVRARKTKAVNPWDDDEDD